MMIEVKNLYKNFGSLEVLKGVNCTVEKSEVVCIIGPSGSGKSTFLRCLNRLEEATSGTILIDGIDLNANAANVAEVRKEVGMVFQSFNLFPHMTVLDNVSCGCVHVKKVAKEQAKLKALELLGKVGLLEKKDAYPEAFRVVSSSVWLSRGRCVWNPKSCCLMSRPLHLILRLWERC